MTLTNVNTLARCLRELSEGGETWRDMFDRIDAERRIAEVDEETYWHFLEVLTGAGRIRQRTACDGSAIPSRNRSGMLASGDRPGKARQPQWPRPILPAQPCVCRTLLFRSATATPAKQPRYPSRQPPRDQRPFGSDGSLGLADSLGLVSRTTGPGVHRPARQGHAFLPLSPVPNGTYIDDYWHI